MFDLDADKRILTDSAFEALIADLPINRRASLYSHHAILKHLLTQLPQPVVVEKPVEVIVEKVVVVEKPVAAAEGSSGDADAERQSIVDWINALCGDADTVRANHARKLAQRIADREHKSA